MEQAYKESSFIKNILHWIIPAAIFLVPVFFLPGILTMYSAKVTLFATFGVLAFIVYLTQLLLDGEFRMPSAPFLLGLVAVTIVSLLSAFFTGAFQKSFGGTGLEVNTTFFWIIGTIFALVAAFSISTVKQLYVALGALLSAAVLTAVVIGFKILGSYGAFPLSWISGIPDTLVGNIVDVVIVLGAATIAAFSILSMDIRSRFLKVVLWLLMVVTLIIAGAMNFKPVLILLAVFSVIHFVYSTTVLRRAEGTRSIPLGSLFVLIASILLLFGGTTLSGFLSSTFRISNFDVRPTATATASLIGTAWKDNPVFGVGPNKFSNVWSTAKPVGVNLTDFWSVDFSNGFGFLPTVSAETGILGTFALVVFIILFFWSGFRSSFGSFENQSRRFLLITLFFVAAYLWLMAIIYSPGISVLVLAFMQIGVFAAALSVLGTGERRVYNLFANSKSNFVSVFLIVVLILLAVAGGYFSWRKAASSIAFTKAVNAANAGSIEDSLSASVRATAIAPSDVYARSAAQLYTTKLQTLIQTIGTKQNISEEEKASLQELVGNGVSYARAAIALDGKNYLNWVYLGAVYETLAQAQVEGALESAAESYVTAKKYAPSNPAISLAQARLKVLGDDAVGALAALDEAIAQKQNYVDAYFLKAQIEVAQNNISGAITSVENATLLDPQNAGLYFQLGLLKYNQQDFRGAGIAFEQAIRVVPDYANAKYFLGLSYDQLGMRSEAVAVFEDLQKTNPDNAEIVFILGNLRANKAPFAGATPPANSKPEKRDTPPITE